MKFTKLTDSVTQKVVWVNMDKVTRMTRESDRFTWLNFDQDKPQTVVESPEQIFEGLRGRAE